MEWVDKMDAVLQTLYYKSGDNPDMDKLRAWLPNEIDIGEIQDITLHLYREKYIYCEVNRDRNADYWDKGRFLISCAGKLFWENEKGFKVYFKKVATENGEKALNELRMIRWTKRLTVATYVAVALIVGWEIWKFWYERNHPVCP